MCVAVIAACGLGDLLSEPRVADVVLTYTGPTTLAMGDTIPVLVTVTVDGRPEPGVRLQATSSDSAVIAVLPSGDRIAGRARGTADLTIRFASAIFTDAVPAIVQQLRVSLVPLPGPPPPPPAVVMP